MKFFAFILMHMVALCSTCAYPLPIHDSSNNNPTIEINKTKNTPLSIYIYNDEGVDPHSLDQIEHTLKLLVQSNYAIKKIDSMNVVKGTWINDSALFVMPGGADLPYLKKLSPMGNAIIKKYVHNGGSYLGICAGAYYAAHMIEFAKGTPIEVIGKRELEFYPDTIIGPTLTAYDYNSESSARAALIKWVSSHGPFKKGHIITSYHNGGGHFNNASKFLNVTVLADYLKDVPAIVEISVGKGRALLSGVHFEYTHELMDQKDPYVQPIQQLLKHTQYDRNQLTAYLLSRLKIETKDNILKK
jgi:glutamine amidotransferase-like uncharacterized protein